jgi:hypothetical protein
MIRKGLAKLGIRNKADMAFAMIAGGGLGMAAGIYRVICTPGTMTAHELGFFSLILLGGAAVWWKVEKDS